MLDRDQRVDPSEKHGIHVHEVHSNDSLGLGSEELPPTRTRPARCRIDAGFMEDLPHRGGGDAMAEPDQFALHPPVSPSGILGSWSLSELLPFVFNDLRHAFRQRPNRPRRIHTDGFPE